MIKWLILLTACVISLADGLAVARPGPDSNYNISVSSGGSPTWTGQTSGVSPSCSFATSCSITVTVTGGLLVVGAGGQNFLGTSQSISAMTISGACGSGSLSTTASLSPSSTIALTAIYFGVVSSGSCTITATGSTAGLLDGLAFALGTLNNLGSNTPGTGCSNFYNNSGTNPFVCSSAITVNSGGFGIAVFEDNGAATLSSANFTIDSQVSTGPSLAIGHTPTSGSLTPSFTSSGGFFGTNGLVSGPWS